MGMPLVRHGVAMVGGRRWVLGFLVTLVLGCFGSAASAAVTLQAGAIPDNFSVSAVGAATYQIPIELPPGVNGLRPSLGLLYDSQAGSGLLGIGWSLTGLSVITRCPQTPAQDQNTHLPDLSLADRFCLDGSRLILTSGTYGAAGSTYRTEIESFQQVTANGTAGNGPASFTVVDRAGLTRIYSTQLMTNGGTAIEWLLTSVTDKYNNYVAFKYNIVGPQYQPVWQEIAEIDYGYGYAGPNTGTPVGRLAFAYGASGDPYAQYFSQTYVGVNMALLTSITVEDGGGAVLRQYGLAYNSLNVPSASPAVSLNELQSVQECAGPGLASCFKPTTFNYDGAFTSFNLGGGLLGTVTMGYLQVADLDGDGLPDYIYEINSQVYVTFGNLNSKSIYVVDATTKQNAPGIAMGNGVPIDLYGDGKQELLVPFYPAPGTGNNQPYWKILSWNGQTGSGASLNLTAFAVGPPSANDPAHSGTVDAIAVDPLHVGQQGLLFVSNRQLSYYPNVNGTLSSTAVLTNIPALDVNGAPPVLTLVNFSGSGQTEVYVAGNGIAYWNQVDGRWELEKAGNFDDAHSKIAFVDNNGDGMTGVFEADQGSFWFFPNAGGGTGFGFQGGAGVTCLLGSGTPDTNQMLVIDWYHDGRREVLIPVNGVWKLVAFNTQTSGCTVTNTNIALQPGQTLSQLLDVDGDGQPDMVFTNTSGATPYTEYLQNGAQDFTLNEVTDGLGHRIQVGYSPSGREVYVTGMNPKGVGPEIQPYVGPMQVVKDFAVDTGTLDGSGNPQQVYTYYLYGGAAVDTWGRGFLGFSQMEAINYNSNLYNTVTYEQAFPFTGLVDSELKSANPGLLNSASIASGGLQMKCIKLPDGEPPECNPVDAPAPVVTWVTGGTTLSRTTVCYSASGCAGDINQVIQTYSGVYYPAAISDTQQLYDLNQGDNFETVTTNTHYRQISNTSNLGVDYMPDDVTVTSTDNTKGGDSGKVETQTVYADDPSASAYAPNCPAHPVTRKATNTFQNVTARTKIENFIYDGTSCFLTSDSKTVFDPAGLVADQALTMTYVPDGYGNPVKVTVTGGGLAAAGRITATTYDVTQRFPVYVTNALNQTESLTYDAWGHKLSDMDANGDAVTYGYSDLGRLSSRSGPRAAVNTSWSDSASCGTDCLPSSAPAVMDTTQTDSDGSVLMTQTDELGRTLRAMKTGFVGGYVLQDTQYDMLGRVVMTTLPYKDSAAPAASCEDLKTYDLLNRVTTEVQPYKTNQDGSCLTRTITTTYADFTTTKIIKDNDPNAKISPEVTATTLNVLAKPDSASDLNAGIGGTTGYTYDPWGNLTNVSSPDKGAVSMAYDSDGDKLSMIDPDTGSWSYRYDALGELTSQTDANGNTVNNTYDALGRLIQRDEPEGHTFWKYDVAYGAGIGRLAYTYTAQPDDSFGSKDAWEGYAYDVYGEATDKITLVNGQEYWVTTTYDDLGRPSQLLYPDMNGIVASGTPAIPAGLNAAIDSNNGAQVDFTWTLAKSGQIYHLFRNPGATSVSGSWTEVYSGPEAAAMDDGITANGQYTWSLEACNGINCSALITATLNVILPPTVPGVPGAPVADTHQNSIALNWTASSLVSTTTGPITYVVKQTNPNGSTTSSTVSTNSMSASLPSDGSYSFIARSCASGACSAWSAAGTYQTYMQPSIPQGLSAPAAVTPSTSPATYQVTWQAPGFVPTSGITYTVQENNTLSNGGFATVQSNGSTTYPASQTVDGEYQYQVQACNLAAPTVCSSFVQVGPVAVTLPPTAPGATSFNPPVDYHSGVWGVDWGTSTLNTGSTGTITYYLYEKFGSGGSWGYVGSATGLFINGIIHYVNGTYYYAVKACTTDPQTSGTACSPLTYSDGYTVVVAPPAPVSLSNGNVRGDGSFDINYGESNPNGIAITYYEAEVGEHDVETNTDSWNDYDCTSSTGTCTVGGLIAGNYQLRVRACDTSVACSDWYPAASPYPKVTVMLAPVLSIAPSPSTNGSYTVSWTAPPETVTGYTLYGSVNGGSYSAVVSQAGTSYALSGKAVGSYSYYVIACYNNKCSAGSNIVTESVIAAPTGLSTPTAAPSPSRNGSFTVSWTTPTGTVTGYNLYESSNGGQTFTLLASQTGTSYAISGRGNGTYTYYYSACNQTACANSFWLTENVYLPPGTVTGLSLSANPSNNGSYTLSWNAASGQVTDYAVYESVNGGQYTQVGDPSGLGFNFSGKANGSYTYYVVARNSGSAAANSATVTEAVHQPPPTPTITGMGPNPSLNGSYSLSWTAVSYATSYGVYQSANGGGFVQIASTGGTSYPISGQGNGSYTYAIIACGSYGCSAASAHVTETVAPSAPSIDATNYQPNPNQSYTVFWSAPPGPVTGYVLSIDAGYPNQRFVNVSGTSSTFSQSHGDTDWYYQVQACNGSVCGAWSAQIDIYVLCGPRGCTAMNIKRDGTQPPAMLAANTPAPMDVAVASASPVTAPAVSREIGSLPTPPTASSSLPAMAGVVKPVSVLAQQSLANLALPPTSGAEAGTPGLSARQAFFLAHADAQPVAPRGHQKRATQLAGEWASQIHRAPAIDPRLSLYPPLRKDPRVLAHFEAEGGRLPAELKDVDCGSTDADSDCSEPVGNALMVGFIYNNVGYMFEVDKLTTDPSQHVVRSKAIWQGLDATAAGEVDLEAFDNAPTPGGSAMPVTTAGATFSIASTYDPASGLMTATAANAVSAGQTVNATYTWDGYNNLLGRTLAETIASAQTQPPGMGETFIYDALNRVTGSSTDSPAGGTQIGNEIYNYQSNDGDLISKGGFSNYQYDLAESCNGSGPTAGHLHAVSSVTTQAGATRTFGYDANGNLLCESGDVNRTVMWSSFNKPTHIQGDAASEDFTYGPGRERLVTTTSKQVNGSPDQVTTVYIDGLFESVYDSASGGYTYKHYIMVGGERVAVETVTANSSNQQTGDTLGFFVHDQVGSVIAEVTENADSTNQQLALMSYDAWGKARPTIAAAAWQPLTAGTFMNPTFAGQHEGFGQHENLDDVGLVDMEGRIYDPEIGRFLSADPTVQFPFSTQGYSRYTYVNNNPLSFSDPSGYSLMGDIGAAGAAGTVIGASGTVIGTSVGIATGVGGTAIGLGSTALGPAIGHSAESWIDQRLSPQEFAVINMTTSSFCLSFYALCYGANTYNYERANGAPSYEAIKAGVASGIEAYASERSTAIFNDGNWAGAAAVAYAGGYASATVDGGNGSLGGDRALAQFALMAAMDELDSSTVSSDPSNDPGMVKMSEGPLPGASNMGSQINGSCYTIATCDALLTTDDVRLMPKNSPIAGRLYGLNPKTMSWDGTGWKFSEISEGGGFMQAVNHHLAGGEAFSKFHDWWMIGAKNTFWIMGTIPFAAYASYTALGGYTQYYLVRSPGHYH